MVLDHRIHLMTQNHCYVLLIQDHASEAVVHNYWIETVVLY